MKPKDPDYQAPQRVAARMRATFDLHQAGIEMMWAKLMREHPDESESQRALRLYDWLHRSPARRRAS